MDYWKADKVVENDRLGEIGVNRIISEYTVEVDTVKGEEWDALIQEFSDANIFQTWEYGAENWGEKKMSHLILKRNGKILAAAQLWVFVIPIMKVGFAHVSWGPMWRLRGHTLDFGTVRNMLAALRQEYVVRRGLLLRIRSYEISDSQDSELVLNCLKMEGYIFQEKEARYHTYRLNLELSLEKLRANLRKTWRKHLNNAERQSIEILSGTEEKMMKCFGRIYDDMVSRKGFVDYVADTKKYENIQRKLPQGLKMRIFLAKYQDEIVAGNIFSAIGDTGIDVLAATSSRCIELKLYAAYLLKWRVIEWLKKNGFGYYDLRGGIDDDMPGIKFFKSGLSGDEIYYLGSFEMCERKISLISIRAGEFIKKWIGKRKKISIAALFPKRNHGGKIDSEILNAN